MSETADLGTNLAVDDERDVEAVTATDASRHRGKRLCERVAVRDEPCGFGGQNSRRYETRSAIRWAVSHRAGAM